jgi:hypothetical protein
LKQYQKRKQQRAGLRSADPSGQRVRDSANPDELADNLILAAAHADCEGLDDARRQSLIDALAQGLGPGRGRELVAYRVDRLMKIGVARALDCGWVHDEISRIVRRRAGAVASSLMAGPLTAVAPRHRIGETVPASWQAEKIRLLDPASSSWQEDISKAIAALSAIAHLPALPDLSGIGSSARNTSLRGDERLLTRIRGLLSKAESSDFAEEADAFMTKAQELMTRYCIDRTMVEADTEGDGASPAEARRVWLEDPYLEAKSLLLANVARANRCRSVVDPILGFCTLVGHPADLDATDLLFTSLLVQAMRRITALGSDPTSGRRSRKPSYRSSILVAYAGRIGARLSEASEAVTMVADTALGNRLLPVLAYREEMLDAAVGSLFGDLKELQFSLTDVAGWAAGTAAADLAELSVREKLPFASAY